MAGPFGNSPDQRLTGDDRGNVNPGILALQCLFILEHNRQAAELEERNPSWSDEVLFQEARIRVRAIIQSIHFNEYTSLLLGEPLPAYQGYNPGVDPSVDVAFAVAAYRYGHSGINSVYWCVKPDGSNCQQGHLLLRDVYFKPSYLNFGTIGDILRGLTLQPEQEIDTVMVDDVRNWVEGIKQDLAMLDIMRGRDGGIASYSTARQQYGLSRPQRFEDITSNLRVAEALRAAYSSVDDVDLWVGGLAEEASGTSFVSETFKAVIKDQMLRSRDGDRFYYKNQEVGGFRNGRFVRYLSDEEIEEIDATKLSDVIRRNTDFTNAPSSVFRKQDEVTFTGLEVMADGETTPSTPVVVVPDSPTERVLQVDDRLTMRWTPVQEQDTELEITLELDGEGWVGAGFGTRMRGSDVVMLTYQNGRGQATDAKATAYALPESDPQQDWRVTSASQSAGVTTWTVARDLLTIDGNDYQLTWSDGGSVEMLFAWSTTESTVGFHGNSRTALRVPLYAETSSSSSGSGGQCPTCTVCPSPAPTAAASTDDDDAATNSNDASGLNGSDGGSSTPDASGNTVTRNSLVIQEGVLSMEWAPPGDSDTDIEITMTLEGTGWMAFGVGTGMANADVYIMSVEGGQGQLTDAISTGYMVPATDGQQDGEIVTATEVDGVTTFTFRRALDTGDGDDIAIGTGDTPLIFAWDTRSDVVAPHGPNRVMASVDLFEKPSGNGTSTARVVGGGGNAYRNARLAAYGFHGISMFSTWGVLVPIGVFTVRFFRHKSFYQQFHRWSMMMAATITIPAAGAAIAASQNQNILLHAYFGVTLAVSIIIQVVLGAATRNWLRSDKRPPNEFFYVMMAHRVLGWLLSGLGMINVYLGVSMLLPEAKYFILGYLVLICVAYAVVGVYDELMRDSVATPVSMIKGKNNATLKREFIAHSNQSMTMEDVRRNVRAGCKFVILEGWVFDVSKFVKNHPGGAYLIERCVGSDIHQYFYGREAFDQRVGKHVHSIRARELLRSLCVGVLRAGAASSGSAGTWADKTVEDNNQWENWTVQRAHIVNPREKRPVVHLALHRQGANATEPHEWKPSTFGRYMLVRIPKPDSSRSTSEEFKSALRTSISGDAPRGGEHRYAIRPYTIVRRAGRPGMELYIRRYEGGELSPLMHNLRDGDRLDMSGPRGLGLHLDDDSSGVVVGVALGTCAYTYYDLIQYVMAKYEYEESNGQKLQRNDSYISRGSIQRSASKRTMGLGPDVTHFRTPDDSRRSSFQDAKQLGMAGSARTSNPDPAARDSIGRRGTGAGFAASKHGEDSSSGGSGSDRGDVSDNVQEGPRRSTPGQRHRRPSSSDDDLLEALEDAGLDRGEHKAQDSTRVPVQLPALRTASARGDSDASRTIDIGGMHITTAKHIKIRGGNVIKDAAAQGRSSRDMHDEEEEVDMDAAKRYLKSKRLGKKPSRAVTQADEEDTDQESQPSSRTKRKHFNDLKLVLMVVFGSEDEVLEADWLLHAAETCPYFELHINIKKKRRAEHPLHRYENLYTGYLDEERLALILPPRNLLTVTLCGSSQFVRGLKDKYLAMGMPRGLVSAT